MNAGRRSRSRMPTPRSRTPTAGIVGARAPARYLTSVCGRGPDTWSGGPEVGGFGKALLAAYPLPPVASGEPTLETRAVGTGACGRPQQDLIVRRPCSARRCRRNEGDHVEERGRCYPGRRDRSHGAASCDRRFERCAMAESGISAGHTMARGVTVARLTLDQLVLVRIQAGQLPRIDTGAGRDRRRSIVSNEWVSASRVARVSDPGSGAGSDPG
jgi:hypothetical protein